MAVTYTFSWCAYARTLQIMDEAHALKNSKSTRAKKLRGVAELARHRVMLTGTPLQNDLLELHALLQFLLPAVFTQADGDKMAAAVRNQDAGAQERLAQRMRRLLTPFIMRR